MIFSRAFDGVRLALPGEKPAAMQVEVPLVSWITDYLTGRLRYAYGAVCQRHQGTILSPSSLSTPAAETSHLQRFSDDSTVVGCFTAGEESESRTVVDDFVT